MADNVILPLMLTLNKRTLVPIHNAQYNFYGKAGNKISNIAAETFRGRTSKPYYNGEKGTFPAKQEGDVKILHEANRGLDAFRIGQQKDSARYAVSRDYNSAQTTIGLFRKTALVDDATARAAVLGTFANWSPYWQRGPDTTLNLGAELHGMSERNACLHIVALACRGCFNGQATWPRVNKVLVQGGWPWLRGYNKAFAKAVFAVMVAIFAAIELDISDPEMGAILMSLAKLLVGRPEGGWTVRLNDKLKDAKVRVAAVDANKVCSPRKTSVEE
jgi:hypothetical protein